MKKLITMAVVAMMTTMTLTSCSKDDNEINYYCPLNTNPHSESAV